MRPAFSSIVLAFLVFGSASCGGTASPSESGTSGDEGDEGDVAMCEMVEEPESEHRGDAIATLGITPPPTPWAQMSREDREMYMVGKVLPIMNQLFSEQFPTRYAEGHRFSCETCHGPDAAARNWAMPSGSLMPLPAQGSPAAASLATAMPESLRFMRETVTPNMGTILGVDSFRCSGCHTSAP